MQVVIKQFEGRTAPSPQDIGGKINEQYQRLKRLNPRGYVDQFEQQIDTFCMDIAFEYDCMFDRDGDELVFDFTQRNGLTPLVAG